MFEAERKIEYAEIIWIKTHRNELYIDVNSYDADFAWVDEVIISYRNSDEVITKFSFLCSEDTNNFIKEIGALL